MTATFEHIKRNNVAGFTASNTFVDLWTVAFNSEKPPIKGTEHQR
jgi:hypothetical protein